MRALLQSLIGKNQDDVAKVKKLREERDEARQQRDEARQRTKLLKASCGEFNPGHFHSPLPDWQATQVPSSENLRALPGIDLNEAGQLDLLRAISRFLPDLPFEDQKSGEQRYYFKNPSFQRTDGSWCYCYLRELRPRRIIEVGSGYTTCLILDMMDRGELHEDGSQLTCIEPNPSVLLSELKDSDKQHVELIAKPLQEVDAALFDNLSADDLLFVDSSHVSKIGSDVNRLIFEILPLLKPGVHVHFHDIFWPFEYPAAWLRNGRAWNEAYLLRAFLQHNEHFQIRQFSSYLMATHPNRVKELLPGLESGLGASIWLEKAR